MSKNISIFNYQEKQVLLYVLFDGHQELRKIMEGLIGEFERTDYSKPLKQGSSDKKTIIDLFLEDREPEFAPLKPYYHGVGFGLAGRSTLENALLEAGVFYAIGKLLLVKCHYRKGLNKLMYASTIPGVLEKFKPLYLFRLGGIYLEQGMMAEAADVLELAVLCCREHILDSGMQKLEELILYQILRVYVIQEDFTEVRKIIRALKELIKEKDNILFLSLLGYFYRSKQDFDKAFKVLNRSYDLYKDNDEIKNKFPRQWFNTLYQLAFCCLLTNQLAKAEVLILDAQKALGETDFRNHGYCENMLGQIEMERRGVDPAIALEHFEAAYHSFEQYNDYRNMARALRSKGSVYFQLKNYTKATQAYNQSLAYDYRTQIKVGILRTLLAKMELRVELVQYNKVEEYLKRITELKIPKTHYLLSEVKKYRRMLKEKQSPSDKIIGNSDAIKKIKEKILRYSKRFDSILILGESGVGKNMIAEAIHKNSRQAGRFMHIECTSIPGDLMENLLFGSKEGGFTGAKNREGLFEEADKGTLFLDEIGDLPLDSQGKLLHFFDQKEIRRVGSGQDIQLDIRVICATNKDLKREVAKGNFRKDLYYRINSSIIQIPPIKERQDDLKELAEHFYIKYCHEFDKHICGIKDEARNYIREYDWPGNVRELENIIKSSIDELEDGQPLSRECLEKAVMLQGGYQEEKPREKPQNKIPENPQENIETPSKPDDLQSLVQSLVKQELERLDVQKGRIIDRKKALNELFLLIQRENPIRKSQIIERYSHLKKSFPHWINILKDQYQVIDIGKAKTHLLYKPMSEPFLKAKEQEGVLIIGEEGYYQLT